MEVFVVGRAGEEREHTARALNQRGCQVHVFERTEDAEDALKEEQPILVVLTDVNEESISFCRKLHAGVAGEMRTVLVAVPADAQDLLPSLIDAGADDYIIVPLNESRLDARMALDIRKAAEKVQRREVEAQLARRVKQQSLVSELGQAVLAGATTGEACDLAVEMAADALGVEYARVLAYEPAEGILRMTAGRGWRSNTVGYFTVEADERWQAGYTLLSSEPVITNDLREETRFMVPQLLLEHDVTSTISVVIPGTPEPYGVLAAHSSRRRTFSKDDVHFVQSVANVLAAVFERTERSITLEKSEARAKRMAAVASRTINGVVITDPHRRVEWVNEGFSRITGYTLDDVRGKVPGHVLQGPETDPKTVAYIRAQLSRNEGFTTEIVNYRKTGERYRVHIEVQPLFDDAGHLTGFMAIETDVTRQRLAEQALRESEMRARAILETTADGIITIDQGGLVESFNTAAERIFQYRAGEVIGRHVKMIIPAPDLEEDGGAAGYFERLRRKVPGMGREVVGLRRDGTRFPMELAVSEVPLGDQVIYTCIIRDITERRHLEQEILEISEQERRRIGQDLHDGLGQMLTGLGLISKDLERRLRVAGVPEAENAAEIAEFIKEADQQARGLARGLVPVELDANGLSTALRRLAANAERLFSITCTFERTGTSPLHDNTTATHLYRIAQEAVNNAVKHGRATRVSIMLSYDDDRVQLRIQDNGIGFRDTSGETQGMGVRIMHYRARIIGGTLDIRDDPAGGTVITCTVSRSPSPGAHAKSKSKSKKKYQRHE